MVEFKMSRVLHGLVTTSARSITVNNESRLSFERFVVEGQNLIKQIEPLYPNEPGVRGFYVLEFGDLMELEGDYADSVQKLQAYKLHEEFVESFKALFSSAAHKWYTLPPNSVLRYDFTDLNKTLEMFMVGAALSLLPWRDDNTCQLTMHGTQLTPGYYYLKMVDMFIFERELPSQRGPFRLLSEVIDYQITITEDYIRCKRKKHGRKSVRLTNGKDQTKSRSTPSKKLDKKRDLGRGM